MSDAHYHVAHLAEPGTVDAGELARTFGASWSVIGRLRLEPGERLRRELTSSEAIVFTLAGTGTATFGDFEQPLRDGISLTLAVGETLDLRAGEEGPLDYFFAELRRDA